MFRIHFTVRHCNRYNHTVPHVMIPGHWSFAKYILSVTIFCTFLSASHPFLVFCFIFISVIYLIFLFVS